MREIETMPSYAGSASLPAAATVSASTPAAITAAPAPAVDPAAEMRNVTRVAEITRKLYHQGTAPAVLTTAVVAVGATHAVSGHVVPNVTAYRIAFLVAAAFCTAALPAAAAIVDSDAARTIPGWTRRMTDGGTGRPARPEEPVGA